MSRLSKLRRDPVQFFRDSRSRVGRGIGAVLARAMYGKELDAPGRRALLDGAGRPSVTVVMAARDAQDTIAAAVASILAQTYENLDLIVVDDASGDRTAEILVNLTANDERLRVLHNDAALGVARARNRGLAQARGDYLTFQDADDTAHPERVERQLAALLATPSARVCLVNGRRVDQAGELVLVNGRRDVKWIISMMFPRAPVFERLGYFRPLRISEDSEYYERIKATFGDSTELRLYKTLYFARFSPASLLFSDGDTAVDSRGDVSHRRSAQAERSLADGRSTHDKIRRGEADPYVARE